MSYKDYFVLPNHDSVRVWSSKRLPFPSGRLDEFNCMRQEIRSALRKLHPEDDQLLHAIYVSPRDKGPKGKCDVENVLFCNVGDEHCGCFKGLCNHGVRFERCYSLPPSTSHMLNKPCHYQSYEFAAKEGNFDYWRRGRLLVEFSTKMPHGMFEYFKEDERGKIPKYIWYWMKHAKIVKSEKNLDPNSSPIPFGIRIAVKCAKNSVCNLASFLKPVIDGTVAAFQKHDGSKQDWVAEILAHNYLRELDLKTQEIVALMNESENAVLGVTKLFWLDTRNERLQICPEDDYCVAGEILLEESGEKSTELSGEIYEVNNIVLPFPERENG